MGDYVVRPVMVLLLLLEIMSSEKFDQLPVVSKDGTVAGVVKLANIKSKLLAVCPLRQYYRLNKLRCLYCISIVYKIPVAEHLTTGFSS